MDTPVKFSSELARLLRYDPISTAQIKEHIKPEELYDLLDLEPPVEPERADNLEDALVQNGFSRRDALTFVCEYFTKAEIMEELEKSYRSEE